MKHFIYKTTHKNGKYYIGRHSTTNIDDGYLGSGKWIRQIKQKKNLNREILEYAESFNHLINLENKYLSEHFGKTNCMNLSNNSTGAPIGISNPMKREEVKNKFRGTNHWTSKNPEALNKLKGDNHWMSRNPERKKDFIENNPNKDGRNAKLAYQRGTHNTLTKNPSTMNAKNGTHHWQNGNSPNYQGKLNKKLVEEGKHNFLGPETNKKRVDEGTHNFVGSASNLKMLAEGKHPSQRKLTCPHCNKTVSSGMYTRWHGDNCKLKVKRMNARQYEKMRNQQLKETMEHAGITDYKSVCLSADQQEYEVELKDGTIIIVPSGLPYHYD